MNFNNLRQSLIRFFYGRYGTDHLNLFLLISSAIIINIPYTLPYTMFLSYGVFAYVIFRTLSKNTYKRRKELEFYNRTIGNKLSKLLNRVFKGTLKLSYGLKGRYDKYRIRQSEKQYFLYFSCKGCKKTLRVPKNKGKVVVTCPICKKETIKKT